MLTRKQNDLLLYIQQRIAEDEHEHSRPDDLVDEA